MDSLKLKSNLLVSYKNSYLSYFLMYNFYYLSWALFSALISVYLLDKGFKASEVSLVVSASFFTSMIAQPFIGMLSDRYDIIKVNIVLFGLAAIGGYFFMFASNLISIIIGYSFVLTLINGTNPTMEKIATNSPYQYGKIRIWGTIGYALGSQLSGLIYDYISPNAIFKIFLITMILTIIGTMGTSYSNEKKETKKKTSTLELFSNKKYIYYLVIYALFTGMTQVGHTYISAMFVDDGVKLSLVSTILSIAVLCEMPIVFFSYKFMDKISNKKLMIIAFAIVIVQFICYGVNVIVPLKILVTLIAKHPTGMLFIMINLKVVNTLVDPSKQITALAFCSTIKSLSSIIFQHFAGYILDITSYSNMYLILLVFMVIGLILVLLFKIPSGNDKQLFN